MNVYNDWLMLITFVIAIINSLVAIIGVKDA